MGTSVGIPVTQRTKGASDRSANQGQLGGDVQQLQNLLFSVNDLLGMGRISQADLAPGARNSLVSGLHGDQSVLGKMLSAYTGNLAASDPTFAATQKAITEGLNFDQNGLPQDYARSLTQGIRQNQSSRGLLDSATSGIQEAVALAGGSEAIRNQRLGQAQSFLSQSLFPAVDKLFPSISTLYGGELQRALQKSQNAIGAAQTGVDMSGKVLGLI